MERKSHKRDAAAAAAVERTRDGAARNKQHFGYLKDDKSNNSNKKKKHIQIPMFILPDSGVSLWFFEPSHFDGSSCAFQFRPKLPCKTNEIRFFFIFLSVSLVGRKIIVKACN